MRKIGCLLGLMALQACTPSALQVQVHAANDLAVGANSILPALLHAYRAEGMQVAQQAPTLTDAQQELERVRRRWHPVWGECNDTQAGPTHHCHDGAWPILVDAQDTWVSILERQAQGASIDSQTIASAAHLLQVAYCGIQSALPPGTEVPPVIRRGCQR